MAESLYLLMPFSQYFSDLTLNWFRGTTVAAPPATNVYLSIHTADPGVTGVNADVSTAVAGGRTTVPISALGAPAGASGGGRIISNTSLITVTSSAADTASVTYFGIWDADTAGNFLCYGILAQPVDVLAGDLLRFPVGELSIRAL
jgi:hypothetical protein